MRNLIFIFILLISANTLSSELSKFESNLDRINSINKSDDLHFEIYQHTLNLGSYSLEYLWKRPHGNGLLLGLVKDSWSKYLEESKQFKEELDKAINDSSTPKEALHALQLIERTQSLYDTYMSNTALRKILLDQSSILDKSIETFFKSVLATKVNKALPKIIKKASSLPIFERSNSVILYKSSINEDISQFANTDKFLTDYIDNVLTVATSAISSGFGAIAGPIEWGDGGQLRDDKLAQDKIFKDLRPLDIIFEKKAYKLTDYTIPGYWGHNAVWLGTKEQLINKGLWEAEELNPFREQIENGNSIFEMRKWGTVFASYEKWMDLDDFAQVRLKGIENKSKKSLLKIYKTLSEQMGKKYDFSFNADTAFKITCSEIIYLSYGDVKWPLDYILGRNTITPNSMAEAIFYNNSPVEFISFVRGDRENGAKFYTKEEFGNLMNFSMLKDGSFVQNYNKCNIQYERTRRGPITFKNKCVKKTRSLTL